MKKGIKPRKMPQQARSRQTREDILEATAHLLNRTPFGEVSTNHIAKKTGISIGICISTIPIRMQSWPTSRWCSCSRMQSSSDESSKALHAAAEKKLLLSTISWKR